MFALAKKQNHFPAKTFLLSLFFIAAGFFHSPAAHAFHNLYNVSGGNPVSLPTVGASAVALPTITVADVAFIFAEDFLDNEVVRVAINTTNYSGVVFDSSVVAGDLTIAGSCGYTIATNIAYSSNDQVVDITLDDTVGNDGCLDAQTFTISGLKIETLYSQDAPGASSLISVDSFSELGSPLSTTDTINLSATPADAASTVTLGDNAVVGADGILTLELTVPYALTEGNSVGMTFAESVDLTGVDAAVTGTLENGGEILCNVTSITLYCEVSAGTTTLTTGTIIITGIRTLYADTANVDVGVEETFGSAKYIAVDQTAEMTDIAAADAAATVTLGGNSVVGGAGDTTLNLTVPFALDANDTIDITFPAHLNVAGVGAAVTGTFENGNEITCAAAAQVVTCTASGTTLTSGTLILTGITSSSAGTDDVSLVEVEDEGVAGHDIATDSTVATTDSTAPAPSPQVQSSGGGGGGGYTAETKCILFGGSNCPTATPMGTTTGTTTTTGTIGATETTGTTLATTPFTDIEGHWAKSIIEEAYLKGLISGKTATLFDPEGGVTRGESAKLLVLLSESSPSDSVAKDSFLDIEGHWAKFFIETLRIKGWSEGYKETNQYKPDQLITLGEFTKLALKTYGYSPATGASPFTDAAGKWYEGYAKKAYDLGVITLEESKVFGGDQVLSRAEALKMLNRLANLK